jgi:hypothetical protein
MVRMRPKPWTQNQPPARRTGWPSTLPRWIEGSFPRSGPRPGASPGWPSRSPSLTAGCTSGPRQASCSGAYPSPRGASSSATSTRACVATMRRCARSWAMRSARASTGLPRSPTLARLCAPTKGANSTPARPISRLTPSRRSL